MINHIKQQLSRAWLQPDPRALGLFRILFGLLLIFDVLKRSLDIQLMYTQEGLIPNQLLFAKTHNFTLLTSFTQTTEVVIFFALSLICLICFTIGYRTKLSHVMSIIAVLSIHGRVSMLNNGAQKLMSCYLILTLLLPLSQRLSVDSILQRDAHPDRADASAQPIKRLMYLGCLLQFAIVYFFSFANKSSSNWSDGSAIYYLLHLDCFNTPLGYALRDHLPMWGSQLLSYLTLITEALLPLLILSPIYLVWTRRLALLTVFGLHTSIALLANVGLFSPAMIVISSLLLTSSDMDKLEGWWSGLSQRGARALQLLRSLGGSGESGESRESGESESSGVIVRLSALKTYSREVISALIIIALCVQSINTNPSTKDSLGGLPQPQLVKRLIRYLHMGQRWSMFAPQVSTGESWLVIDAQLKGGERLDPQTGLPPVMETPNYNSRVDFSQSWRKYTKNISKERYADYREHLSAWLLKPQRHLYLSEDQTIESFDVWVITDSSPLPEDRLSAPSVQSKVKLLSYSAPQPKLESR